MTDIPLKVAVVIEWLTDWAGSERIMNQILIPTCFPNADLYALVDFFPTEYCARIIGKNADASFLQRDVYSGAFAPLSSLEVNCDRTVGLIKIQFGNFKLVCGREWRNDAASFELGQASVMLERTTESGRHVMRARIQ